MWTRSAGADRRFGLVEDTSAQAMVEFAIVAPILLIIIFGIMELALMFNAYQQVHYAAFVAVRSAIVTIPEAYPKGPDEDREDPYLMAQEGSKTPKRNAMELAAEIAMIPVSSPISGVVSDGIGNLPNMLSNLEAQFNNLMSDLGISGGARAAFRSPTSSTVWAIWGAWGTWATLRMGSAVWGTCSTSFRGSRAWVRSCPRSGRPGVRPLPPIRPPEPEVPIGAVGLGAGVRRGRRGRRSGVRGHPRHAAGAHRGYDRARRDGSRGDHPPLC